MAPGLNSWKVNNQILFEASPWYILLCLLAGLVYAYLLYSTKSPWGRRQSVLLAAFRFILVSAIAFLLLGPLIRHLANTVIEPSLVIAVDNSRSIPESYSVSDFEALKDVLDDLSGELSENDLEIRIKDLNGQPQGSIQQMDFNIASTDLNNTLRGIGLEYEGKNLAGVILVSDGIYNHGSSPIYTHFAFPVYTLGIGDTTEKEDVILRSLNYNKIVYQGNKFLLQAEIYNKGFSGMPVSITLRKQGRALENKIVTLQGGSGLQTVEFEVEAEFSGMQRYEVFVNPLPDEFSLENNTLNAYVEVVEGKEKILLLALSPHPDLKALKSLIEKNDNYEVDMVISGINQRKEDKYDLGILHQLPDAGDTFQEDIQQLIDNGTPILHVLGARTNLPRFNDLNHTIDIKSIRNQRDNVFVSANSNFGLFNISEAAKSVLSELPPVTVPFGEYTLKGESDILLFQRIGRITTEKPALIIHKNPSNKEAVLVGEGLWKWRLNAYLIEGNFDGIDNLFNKVVQYLSTKEDRRKFKVYPIRTDNWDNEPVIFENEIYNDIYEKVYDQKIDLSVTDEAGENYEYSYVISNANSQFRISGLMPGVYSYNAKTNLNGDVLSSEGMFSISQQVVEITNLTADFGMLRELSRRSSGKFFLLSETNDLVEEINNSDFKSLIYSSENYIAIINLKWIFFLILLLVSLEWGLRKYFGSY